MILLAAENASTPFPWAGLLIIHVIAAAGVALWYIFRLRLRNTITVPFSKINRAVTYIVGTGEKRVYGPGTHHLSPNEKLLEMVDTNVRNVPASGDALIEKFRAGSDQVYFRFEYEYQVWYERASDPGDEYSIAHDEILDRSVLRAYQSFDQTDERFRAVQQVVSQQLETAGRTFSPSTLSDTDKHPCDIRVLLTGNPSDSDRQIMNIDWVREYPNSTHPDPDNLPALPASDSNGMVIRITNERLLFDFFTRFITDTVNTRIRKWGMELANFNVHDIPYDSADLQTRAEKAYEAKRLKEAVEELLAQDRGYTPQEAMLIALGQDARYASLIIQQNWQKLIREISSPDEIRKIIEAIVNRSS